MPEAYIRDGETLLEKGNPLMGSGAIVNKKAQLVTSGEMTNEKWIKEQEANLAIVKIIKLIKEGDLFKYKCRNSDSMDLRSF